MNDKRRNAQPMSDKVLDRLVYEALLLSGRIAPQTPEEVEIAMSDFDESSITVPPELLDLDSVLGGAFEPDSPNATDVRPDVVSGLACAARHGTDIPEEVRQQMNKDRKKAEEEHGHGSN
jgi:hypothetical protein